MSVVPVIFSGVFYPKNKKDPPLAGTFVGNAAIAGLEVGGGPILPPDEVPPVDPPLVIWGGPYDPPHPEHPIVLPDPPVPPLQPPASTTEQVHPGWNFNDGKNPQYPNVGWYYVHIPGEGEAEPKRRR